MIVIRGRWFEVSVFFLNYELQVELKTVDGGINLFQCRDMIII